MNKRKGKNDQKNILRPKFYFKNVNLFKTLEKKTNFLHTEDCVVDSVCLNLCLIELTASKLRKFVMEIVNLYDSKIKISY